MGGSSLIEVGALFTLSLKEHQEENNIKQSFWGVPTHPPTPIYTPGAVDPESHVVGLERMEVIGKLSLRPN